MKGFKSAMVSIFIVALLVMVLGLCVVQIRNCSEDEPVDVVEVEEIILNETEIIF